MIVLIAMVIVIDIFLFLKYCWIYPWTWFHIYNHNHFCSFESLTIICTFICSISQVIVTITVTLPRPVSVKLPSWHDIVTTWYDILIARYITRHVQVCLYGTTWPMSCHVVCMSCGVSCHVFTVRSLKYIFVVLCDACRAMHVVCWMTRHTLYDMEIYVFL